MCVTAVRRSLAGEEPRDALLLILGRDRPNGVLHCLGRPPPRLSTPTREDPNHMGAISGDLEFSVVLCEL